MVSRVLTGHPGGLDQGREGVEMTAQAGGTVRAFMLRYLEVVPEDATIVAVAERMQVRQIGSVLAWGGTSRPRRASSSRKTHRIVAIVLVQQTHCSRLAKTIHFEN